ncbi:MULTISPECIES: hypothetical protein [unclassified Streptomyces]|uniref:hypothetical protein n=1 Tax=unclassified Streptomyces TaxID=2593676 RepID=UPI002DD8F6F8|nr:hypothetical protein [Streptomyces sp. NBC_00151]WRZ40101.1 hypothetical protein OG915_19860 [Streptomyces sp. NBC_00151]
MLNSGRPQGGSGEWEQPFWQQRSWVLSAGFLLVLLVLAGATMLSGGNGTPADASGGGKPAPSTDADRDRGGRADARPAGCRTDDSDQAKPTRAPKDFEWKADGTGLVPVSGTVGPLTFDGPVWSCFAHTPMGSVMAAHTITDHLSFSGWREVVDRQVVPGAGRDALVASRTAAGDRPASGEADGGGYAGFTVLSYDKEKSTVMFVVRVPGKGSYGTASVTLRWLDGDWKLSPDADGTVYSGMSQISGTKGFVTWEA